MHFRADHPVHRLVIAATALALALAIGACGRDSNVYEPIANPPASGTTVAGTVHAQTGGALANAVVTIERIENGLSESVKARIDHVSAYGGAATPEGAASGAPLRSTVTDDQGRFAFTGCTSGGYLITATHANHMAGVERLEIPPAAPESVSVDIVLTPTGAFYGSATLENADNHQSTVVYVEGTSFVGVTDPDGDYTITGIPVGTWTVRATHPRYLDASAGGTIAAAGDSIALASMLLKLDSNIAPVANAVGPPLAIEQVPAEFTGTGNDADGSIVRYEWDFENDGTFDYSSPTSATTTHAYPATGNYIAKLRVTDDDGEIDLDVVPVTVNPAVFVSATTGAPGNPGTKAEPLSTITDGIATAVSETRSYVLVANGTYYESPAFTEGVSVLGGYDPATWAHTETVVTVSVGVTPTTADGIVIDTEISQLGFVAEDIPPGANSIALTSASSEPGLLFTRCMFQAGNGGAGENGGPSGVPGAPGSAGHYGYLGTCDGAEGAGGPGGSSPYCNGGTGGRGGLEGANDGQSGFTGACGGGYGGYGGTGGDPGEAGGHGGNGAAGTDGPNGSAADGSGAIVGGVWTPNTSGDGNPGGNGRGGGGGGGGGGQGCLLCNNGGGNGGGGGGGGGGGSPAGGGGGQGGWASFGVFLVHASPTFSDCTFQTGSGGNGGVGRPGAMGGSGGPGGMGGTACLGEIGRGGDGGDGGDGGASGGGAGGPGGPSFGVWREATSAPTFTGDTNWLIGPGGSGGSGGSSPVYGPAPSGPMGEHGNVH